jgi:hypothetical protein
MKKGAVFFIVVTVLCLTVLIAGLSSGKKVCPKKSYLCSSFTLEAAARTVSRVEHDPGFLKTAQPELIYTQEFLSSIFHPPKHIS